MIPPTDIGTGEDQVLILTALVGGLIGLVLAVRIAVTAPHFRDTPTDSSRDKFRQLRGDPADTGHG